MSAAHDPAPALSVVIPACNEAACIRQTVTAILDRLEAEGIAHEVIVVDNGSTDATGAILEQLSRERPSLKALRLEENAGYGGAILRGLRQGRGAAVGFTCADGEVAPGDLVTLWRVLEAGGLDICKGKRIGRQDGFYRKVLSMGYHFLVGLLFRVHITDINGYPVLIRREAYERLGLRETDWMVNLDLLNRARAHGLRMAEIDVRHLRRAGGRSHVRWYFPLLFLWQMIAYRRRFHNESGGVSS